MPSMAIRCGSIISMMAIRLISEFGVDVLKLEHLVIGHVGFGQQHVHVAGHATRDRVDRVLHLDAFLLQQIAHFAQRVLGLRHRHAVAGHDDDLGGVLHDEGGVVGRAELGRLLLAAGATGRGGLAAEAAEDDRDEGTVHRAAHDVGQDRARRADQRAGDNQRGIAERETDAGSSPAGIGFNIEITTGMSAPPIGMIMSTPSTRAMILISQKSSALPDRTRPKMKKTSATASAMLMAWRNGRMIGAPLMRAESFRNAITEPAKVI